MTYSYMIYAAEGPTTPSGAGDRSIFSEPRISDQIPIWRPDARQAGAQPENCDRPKLHAPMSYAAHIARFRSTIGS